MAEAAGAGHHEAPDTHGEAHAPARRGDLTRGTVHAQLVRLSMPMVWGIVAVQAFQLADAFWVGRLGTEQLAALGFTFPVIFTYGAVAMGLGTGAGSVIARAIGTGDRERVRMLTTNALVLAVLVVAIGSIVGVLTIEPLFTALGAGPGVMPYIRDYMTVWYWGILFLVVPMVGNSAIRATGDSLTPSLVMIAAAVLNMALSPVLIFGWLGAPAWGVKGAAIATVASRAVTLLIALYVLHVRENLLVLNRRSILGFFTCCTEVLQIGLPAAFAQALNPIAIMIVTAFVAAYGADAVAAFGVASRIESFAAIPLMALSTGIAPFVGQNAGAGKDARVQEALKQGLIASAVWGLLAAIVLAFAAAPLANLFTDDAAVVRSATHYLWIVPPALILGGSIFVANSAFNALGRPIEATVIVLVRFALLYVPLALVLPRFMGLSGIFVAAGASYALAGAYALWRVRR